MQTLVILVAAAGIAAGVVWWASAPAAPRTRTPRARTPRARPSWARRTRGEGAVPGEPSSPASGFEASAATASPAIVAHEAAPETLVLEQSTLPEERPSRVLALVRLILTIAFVAAFGVALLAAVWLLLNNQLEGYLAR